MTRLHLILLIWTIGPLCLSDVVIGQSYSAELSDSSYSIVQENGNIKNTLAQISANKINGAGQISLSGNFPTISLLNLQIGHKGGNELGLDGDLVPFESVTFDVGNNVSDEHWDQVVAETFVTYIPNNFAASNKKSLASTLPNLLMLNPIQYTSHKNGHAHGFSIKELKKYAPSVLVSEDYDFDPVVKKYKSSQTEVGINYNAFIPLLVKAIQEQESTIRQLKSDIQTINKLINK